MAEQDQFGPPGNLSSQEGGGFIDDVKMAYSKFFDNYMDRSLTENEEAEVERIAQKFNVNARNIDLVRHYVVGQRFRRNPAFGTSSFFGPAIGVGVGFGAEALDAFMDKVYGGNYTSGFSSDDAFATSYGSLGYSPSQVANIGGFSHTQSAEESDHQGLFGKNFSKFGQLLSKHTFFGNNINDYLDAQMDTNFSKGMLGTKAQDPRDGGT